MSILPSGSMETLEGIKQHVQVSVLAIVSASNNSDPSLYAALQSSCEGLCYEPFAPLPRAFLLHSCSHGVFHLQDIGHLAGWEL